MNWNNIVWTGLLPAPRYVNEWQATEAAVLKIATLINSSSHEHLQRACRIVASHYPQPSHETLECLYVDLANNNMTNLNLDFHREYCRKQEPLRDVNTKAGEG